MKGHLTARWDYAAHIDPHRIARLRECPTFERLVDAIVTEAKVLSVKHQRGRDPTLAGAVQAVAAIELPDTGDLLFNSERGYRGAYWRAPAVGLAANMALIEALRPKLKTALQTASPIELDATTAMRSFEAVSAKVWPDEGAFDWIDCRCLVVERWISAANRGELRARWGLMAPAVTRFEVKGALFDPHGNEIVPAAKASRHFEIHLYGWS